MPGLTLKQSIAYLYQQESRKVLATLIRLLGDFQLAEEALQDAFSAALEQWPQEGVPDKPRAWLISTGRFKAIDRLRKNKRFQAFDERDLEDAQCELDSEDIADDQLRLIFTCCHPALKEEARIVLTLREVCGLSTEQVAKALLQKPATIAQRIVRAKRKIRAANIPYEVPERAELSGRLSPVLHVIYLIFNEGYSASSGDKLIDAGLMDQAIALTRELVSLLDHVEIRGLLALLLFQSSRQAARLDAAGGLIRLDAQDRTLWNADNIREADQLLKLILPNPDIGFYTLQAAIAGLHADTLSAKDTNWHEILAFYDVLMTRYPSPVIELNRVVAVAMSCGAEQGLKALAKLNDEPELAGYYLFHACWADLLARVRRFDEASLKYQEAIKLCPNRVERDYLIKQLYLLQDNHKCRSDAH